MKKIIIILFLIIAQIIATQCFAETVECGKMEGVILNINNKYAPIDFSAEKVIFQWNGETAQMLAANETMPCVIIENNKNLITCVNILDPGVSNMVTYSKIKKLLFYSKNNALYQSAYHAKCQPMK